MHQPGSSFKPYVLTAAFEQGIPPTAIYSGVQGVIPDPRCMTNGQPWNVTNAEGTSLGSMNLYDATAYSVNAVFARLILDVGPENVVAVAHEMGITTPLPAVCALATGSVGISPLDQASGYQTLADGGIHCKPFAVAEVLRGDQILYRQRPDCQQVVPAPIANLVNDLLKGPVTYGTAASVFSSGWGKWPIRGKTGTAQDNTEVWFAGYTPQVVTAVWVGSQGRPYPLADYWGYDVFGATVAAPIWKAFMLNVLQGYPAERFPAAGLTTVPNVIGKPLAEARQLIRGAHLQTAAQVVPSYLPAGTVVTQLPSAGTQVVPTQVVTVSVSNGVAPIVTLPDVVGSPLSSANGALGAIHVFVTVVDQPVKQSAKSGIVLSMSPVAGTKVKEGSSVTLVVGVDAVGQLVRADQVTARYEDDVALGRRFLHRGAQVGERRAEAVGGCLGVWAQDGADDDDRCLRMALAHDVDEGGDGCPHHVDGVGRARPAVGAVADRDDVGFEGGQLLG